MANLYDIYKQHLCLLLIACVTFHHTHAAPSSNPTEGDIKLQRLNGFLAEEAGTVLIYHAGRWGTVCDDGWVLTNAHVICRMLGYTGAIGHTKNAYFGIPTEDFWLDDVQCTGEESSIADCRHLTWGSHNCALREAAGVFCAPRRNMRRDPPQTNQRDNHQRVAATTIIPDTTTEQERRRGGHNRAGTTTIRPENLVEIVQLPERENNRVEPEIERAQLRTAPPARPQNEGSNVVHNTRTQGPRYEVNNEASETTISSINNEAIHQEATDPPRRVDNTYDDQQTNEINAQRDNSREDSHTRHQHRDHARPTEIPRRRNRLPPTVPPYQDDADMLQNDAVVDAILTMEDKIALDAMNEKPKYDIHKPPDYKLSLSGGRTETEGLLKVTLDGRTGTICADDWDLREGMVVCRQLGLDYCVQAVVANFFGGGDDDKLLAGIQCEGHESSLRDCVHGQIGDVACSGAHAVAGVMCTNRLPDLVPNATLLETSSYLQDRQMYYLQCAMEEGCASSSAYTVKQRNPNWFQQTRRLLRFSSSTWNFGTADFRPFQRKENWEWHQCHMHYHSMEVFAQYDLLDKHGNKVAEGHKASFCLEDVQCLPGRQKRYACVGFGDQGISVGCADDYLHDIDCQWIDISDVTTGDYIFQVHVNPGYNIAEMNFDNNVAQCDLNYNGSGVTVKNCVIVNDGYT